METADLYGGIYAVGLILAGATLLWKLALSPAARARAPAPALPFWDCPGSDPLLLFLVAIGGGLLLPMGTMQLLRLTTWSSDARLVWAALAFQLGLCGGAGVFFLTRPPDARLRAGPWRRDLRTGAVTFLVAMPLVLGTELLWQNLLALCGLPVKQQDTLALFLGIGTPGLRALFFLAAVIVAPVSEELLFRAGLFRFFRGRMPRWIALLVPAALFGGSHLLQAPLDGLASLVPLIVLGVVFSLAYERTGSIGTTIVAHALFNLNTLTLVLLGVTT